MLDKIIYHFMRDIFYQHRNIPVHANMEGEPKLMITNGLTRAALALALTFSLPGCSSKPGEQPTFVEKMYEDGKRALALGSALTAGGPEAMNVCEQTNWVEAEPAPRRLVVDFRGANSLQQALQKAMLDGTSLTKNAHELRRYELFLRSIFPTSEIDRNFSKFTHLSLELDIEQPTACGYWVKSGEKWLRLIGGTPFSFNAISLISTGASHLISAPGTVSRELTVHDVAKYLGTPPPETNIFERYWKETTQGLVDKYDENFGDAADKQAREDRRSMVGLKIKGIRAEKMENGICTGIVYGGTFDNPNTINTCKGLKENIRHEVRYATTAFDAREQLQRYPSIQIGAFATPESAQRALTAFTQQAKNKTLSKDITDAFSRLKASTPVVVERMSKIQVQQPGLKESREEARMLYGARFIIQNPKEARIITDTLKRAGFNIILTIP